MTAARPAQTQDVAAGLVLRVICGTCQVVTVRPGERACPVCRQSLLEVRHTDQHHPLSAGQSAFCASDMEHWPCSAIRQREAVLL